MPALPESGADSAATEQPVTLAELRCQRREWFRGA